MSDRQKINMNKIFSPKKRATRAQIARPLVRSGGQGGARAGSSGATTSASSTPSMSGPGKSKRPPDKDPSSQRVKCELGKIRQLVDLGYPYVRRNQLILRQARGDVTTAVSVLDKMRDTEDKNVENLRNMGFDELEEDDLRLAINLAGNNMDEVISIVTEELKDRKDDVSTQKSYCISA